MVFGHMRKRERDGLAPQESSSDCWHSPRRRVYSNHIVANAFGVWPILAKESSVSADDSGKDEAGKAPSAEKPDGKAEENVAEKAVPKKAAPSSIAGRKVLVVDDHNAIRKSLGMIMEKLGAMVEACGTAEEAMGKMFDAHAEGELYELVFLDLMLPDMPGWEVLSALRGDPSLRETRVVIVSARNTKEDLLRCGKLGISAYVLKPFNFARIREVAEKALANPAVPDAAKGAGKGLSPEEAKLLRRIVVETVESEGHGSIADNPVAKAVVDFLDERCGRPA